MRRFFVDTFYWIALFSRRDRWHARVAGFDAWVRKPPEPDELERVMAAAPAMTLVRA